MTVIPIVSAALGTASKVLVQGLEDLEIRGQVKTIQTTVLEYREESWRLEGTCSHSDSSGQTSANAGVKNS